MAHIEPPLNNIRQCDMTVVLDLPTGPVPAGYKATAYHLFDPDLEPRKIASVFAIRMEYWPDGQPVQVDLLMADDYGKPLVRYDGGLSTDDAENLAFLPKVWWRCAVAEVRVYHGFRLPPALRTTGEQTTIVT